MSKKLQIVIDGQIVIISYRKKLTERLLGQKSARPWVFEIQAITNY